MQFRNLIVAFGLSLVIPGCTQLAPVADVPGCQDCPDGFLCVDASCVAGQDVVDDAGMDAHLELPDAGDPDAADTGDRVEADDGLTSDAADADSEESFETIEDTGTDDGEVVEYTVGNACESDLECIDGECVVMVSSGTEVRKVCTGPCGLKCPAGMACMNHAITVDGFETRCEPFENGLCFPCESASDCLITGAQCLKMAGGNSFCTVPCEGADSRCPYGFECKVLGDETILPEFRAQCQPAAGGCDCVFELAQARQPCRVVNDSGTCEGTLACYPEVGWLPCSAAVPADETCDGKDNDCDGATDEDFRWTDWDQSGKEIGAACGIGACAGGKVQCLGTSGATCSTAYLATTENCGSGSGNGRDDDCDGTTDEDCEIADADGDGVKAFEGDCNDYDSAFYPGAREPCCPPAVASSPQAIARCDRNCDGAVTACDINDRDFDGYSNPHADPAMRDCDDGNAAVHPGAPEKCDDGLDNDCMGDGDLHCCYADSEPGCVGPFDPDGDHYVGSMDCDDQDPGRHPGAMEICDFIDNDCDGITDNGNPGGLAVDPSNPGGGTIAVNGGSRCGLDEGECLAGIWVCVRYDTFAGLECIGSKPSKDEICDDLDNDCDGSTDEDFPGKGLACDGDDLDQCANGVNECNLAGTGIECIEPFALADLVDTCGDGIDQDCDGITDGNCFPTDLDGDGYLPPADCDDTRSEVRPWAIEPCCDYRMSKEDALAACDWDCNGMTAKCNPVDYDFDGAFDRDQGGTDCDEEDPTVRPGFPDKCGDSIDQDCSGVDTTCDSIVDRDGDRYASFEDCDDNNAFRYPWAPEECNGIDDDCDGITDEGNPGTNPEVTCGSNEGICRIGAEVCVHFKGTSPQIMCVPEVLPAKEMCDGIDNNCNGRTDEVFRDLGLPCDGPDSDQCRNGRFVCSEDGSATVCGPELREDIVEVCDGIDNDCDGLTDEDFQHEGLAIGAECEGWGICGPGLVVCSVDGVRATCSTNWDGPDSQAQPETCDGIDNDCDNRIDNGMMWYGLALGSLCRGIGECGIGHVECNPSTLKAVCSVNPDGSNPRDRREWCNGLDDDCDGRTDDNLVGTEWDCLRAGVCRGLPIPAECVAGQWECDYTVVPEFQADETRCDNQDNDCDGQTDEGFGKGDACDGPDYDRCKNGILVCKADGTGVECGPETIENITEKCNRIDDDCDGRTDEDFPIGELCDGPDNDQCKNGSFTCSADTLGVVCNNEWIKDIVETCNQVDDDCDGLTDEDFAVGLPCDSDDPDLCAFGKTVCNQAGNGVVCHEDPEQQATTEKCNGVDDDCNGQTDEGFLYLGTAVGGDCDGIGQCGAGKVVCTADSVKATCSTNADGTTPQAVAEACDMLDNDCDGSTDEGLTWRGIAMGQPCVADGNCAGGTVVCSPTDLVATCSTMPNGTEPGATTEKCDNIDNDCDGFTDEDIPQDLSSCRTAGICLPSLVTSACVGGSWACNYSAVAGFEQGAETKCDGLDNNCDGNTDETWSVGQACDGPDDDLCKNGVMVCNPDGKNASCSSETGSFVETCGDSVDNDCDGATDEEGSSGCKPYWFSGDGDLFGVGSSRCLCYSGQVTGFVATAGGDCNDSNPNIYPGATELCNYKDDDCDGQTDKEPQFLLLGGSCDSSDPDTCANGMWVCSPDGTALVCQDDYNSAEKCNGVDDDCNGQTDELWQLGQPCDGPDSDLCQNSTWICKPDGSDAQCVEAISNITERCNGKDDDCDGFTDETFTTLGLPCDGSDPDSCANGTYTCKANGSGVECVNEPGTFPSGTEYCDGFDNNCNGSADENWPNKSKRCDSSDTDTCRTGINLCNGSQTGIECVGDVVCATGATCTDSGSEYLPDRCLCGLPPVVCSRTQGSTCTAGVCKCGNGAACSGTQQCLSDGLGGYACQ